MDISFLGRHHSTRYRKCGPRVLVLLEPVSTRSSGILRLILWLKSLTQWFSALSVSCRRAREDAASHQQVWGWPESLPLRQAPDVADAEACGPAGADEGRALREHQPPDRLPPAERAAHRGCRERAPPAWCRQAGTLSQVRLAPWAPSPHLPDFSHLKH